MNGRGKEKYQAENGHQQNDGHQHAVAEEQHEQGTAGRGKIGDDGGDAEGGGHPQVHLLHEDGHAGTGHAHGAGIITQVLHEILPRETRAVVCSY